MSQSGIARAAFVNQSTVSRMERDLRMWGVLVWRSPDGREVPVGQGRMASAAWEAPLAWAPSPGEAPTREIQWTRELLEVRCERPGWRRRIDLAMALLALPEEFRPTDDLVYACLRRRPITNGDAVLEAWYAGAIRRLVERREREALAVAEALERRRREQDERSTGCVLAELLTRYRPGLRDQEPKCIPLERPDITTSTTAGGALWPNEPRSEKICQAPKAGELRQLVAEGLVRDTDHADGLYGELTRATVRVGERNPRSVWSQLVNLSRAHPFRTLDELVGLYDRAVIQTGECGAQAAAGRREPVLNPAAFAVGVLRRALTTAA